MKHFEHEYPYRPRWTVILLAGVFFALCAVGLGYFAQTNQRGLVLLRVIELDPDDATVFLWVMAALSAGFVAMSCAAMIHRLTLRQRIAFTADVLIVPNWWWSRLETTIPYREIVSLAERTVNGQRFFQVVHGGGKFTLSASMLPSRAVFDEVCERLTAKVREHAPTS